MSHRETAASPPIGLDGVAAAATALSHVDGLAGRLIIAGEPVEALAGAVAFEGVAGRLVGLARAQAPVALNLGAGRIAAFTRLAQLQPVLTGMAPIAAMRTSLAAMIADDPETLIAAGAVCAAACARLAAGQALIAPDPSSSHAADFLRMIRGTVPSEAEARAMDTYFVTIADHGMNASTFAARVAASTRAGLIESVTAGYCALTGPLHGGAPGPVLDMLDEIFTPNRIDAWIKEALSSGDRLMGFGHRIYRVRDPRADVLRTALEELAPAGERMAFARQVETAALAALRRAKPDRPLDTNVEFYTALLLEALTIPRAAFTPTFAAGRIAGWVAHAIEQQRIGRLLRPDAVYLGAH
jgi:citrate synthase